MAWHEVVHRAKTGRTVVRIALTLGQVIIPLGWAYKEGVFAGVVTTLAWAAIWFFKHWQDTGPKVPLERNAVQRNMALVQLHADLERHAALTVAEVQRFQEQALWVIASCVRDHRNDGTYPTIFANLLVVEGDEMVVIARDREHRGTPRRYPKANTVVDEAFTSGEAAMTGDVYADFPDTPPGKPYRSILAIPIRRKDGSVLGVVSIDSTRRYHFDIHWKDLIQGVVPFVHLLRWTVEGARATKIAATSEGEVVP